jgi:hypothetical protein
LQPGFDVAALDQAGRASFGMALHDRRAMTWTQIILSGRHGFGTEMIPTGQLKGPIPPAFRDEDKFLMLRYRGKLPMGGVRVADTFHIIWLEPQFGDLYDHG